MLLKRNRINFMHTRNVTAGAWGFQETAHLSQAGDIDMNAVVKLLVDYDWTGALRPDHGRRIWGDQTKTPGYGLYDRALGATYLLTVSMKPICEQRVKHQIFGITVKTVGNKES